MRVLSIFLSLVGFYSIAAVALPDVCQDLEPDPNLRYIFPLVETPTPGKWATIMDSTDPFTKPLTFDPDAYTISFQPHNEVRMSQGGGYCHEQNMVQIIFKDDKDNLHYKAYRLFRSQTCTAVLPVGFDKFKVDKIQVALLDPGSKYWQ